MKTDLLWHSRQAATNMFWVGALRTKARYGALQCQIYAVFWNAGVDWHDASLKMVKRVEERLRKNEENILHENADESEWSKWEEERGCKRWWVLKDLRTNEMIHLDKKREWIFVVTILFLNFFYWQGWGSVFVLFFWPGRKQPIAPLTPPPPPPWVCAWRKAHALMLTSKICRFE